MTNKKNIYLWSKNILSGALIPLLWVSAKTYYEENSTKSDLWNWCDPFIHNRSTEDILEYLTQHPPAIFGLSVYVWSHNDADILAKEIKSRWPNCLIIYGGPQNDIKYSNDFFSKKPWVDLVVPSDVYGEPILTYILDNFDNLKYGEIPEVYYHKNTIKFRSKHKLTKREFVFPKNIFSKQKDYLKFDQKNSTVIYETTRGCPYGCIYCDWGGGTYTKVVKKPLDTIYSELESLAQMGIEFLSFADANFGIYKDDIKIIEEVVRLKNKYGYPLAVHLENAKNNLDRVIEIQQLLIKNNLTHTYKISVQHPDEVVKTNINRVDLSFDHYVSAIKKLKKEFNAPILLETILGLPGDNYKLTLDTIDLIYSHTIDIFRPQIWQLLPEAPAYDPVMREKFKIETKWFEVYTHPFRYKDGYEPDVNVRTLKSSSMVGEHVIGCYSYSKEEWADMVAISMVSAISKTVGIDLLINYLHREHQLPASVFYDRFYRDIVIPGRFDLDMLNNKFLEIPKKLSNIIKTDQLHKLEFDIDKDFPLLLSIHVYVSFLIMMYPESFFKTITTYFSNYLNDPNLKDLGTYLTNIMIDPEYDPAVKRTFETTYNWYGYFNLNNPLTKGLYEYKILDEMLQLSGAANFEYSDYPVQTDTTQKLKQFFYHRVANSARKKYAQHIIERKL